jgi:DNA-binding response OmpR family regulator
MKKKANKIVFVGHSHASLASIQTSLKGLGRVEHRTRPCECNEPFDLVIIELGEQSHEEQEALKLCSEIRRFSEKVPIVVFSSSRKHVTSETLVDFLFRGADELVQGPIERAGFAARARSLIRRASWSIC